VLGRFWLAAGLPTVIVVIRTISLATNRALLRIPAKQRNALTRSTPIDLPFGPIRIGDDLGNELVTGRYKFLVRDPFARRDRRG
jgi:hypothetical protein